MLARGSALRFLLTRLYDWLHQVEGALVKPKDPREYLEQAPLPSRRRRPAAYGLDVSADTAEPEPVEIHTDGACSGNPGPGGWGAILDWNGKRRELSGGEPLTTNNRMELMARDRGARDPEAADDACVLFTDSQYLRQGITEWIAGWKRARLAHRRQEAGQEPGPVGASRRRPQAAPGRVALAQGPCRPRAERARRRAGARGDQAAEERDA